MFSVSITSRNARVKFRSVSRPLAHTGFAVVKLLHSFKFIVGAWLQLANIDNAKTSRQDIENCFMVI